MRKKIVDTSQSENPELDRKERSFGKNAGIANKKLIEPIPTYEKAGSERLEKGKNNTLIIQGRDRPAGLGTGYGSKGATQAGRIDLIAGLASSFKYPDGSYGPPPNKETIVSPNFAQDASRVYISQRADIDKYMGLAFVDGQPEGGRSAIALKSDQIRIHSRQDIKIVTGRGLFNSLGSEGERLSNGGVNQPAGKICFIAGNNTDEETYNAFNILETGKPVLATKRKLQPLVKGDNLVMCLNDIVDLLNQTLQFVGMNTLCIRRLNNAFMTHAHPVTGPSTVPFNTNVAKSIADTISNESTEASRRHLANGIGMIKNAYLTNHDEKVEGALYINSNFVYTT